MTDAGSRVTTAQARGALRGGGRGRQNAISQRGRGKGKKRKEGGGAESSATGSGRGQQNARARTTSRGRAVARGRASNSTNVHSAERAQYRTGEGSAHWMLFGDEDAEARGRRAVLPDLNAEMPFDEFLILQNAPQ